MLVLLALLFISVGSWNRLPTLLINLVSIMSCIHFRNANHSGFIFLGNVYSDGILELDPYVSREEVTQGLSSHCIIMPPQLEIVENQAQLV